MDRIEIYEGRGVLKRNRGWRWRYVAPGNNARLATGAESYHSQDDALKGVIRVCGLPEPIPGQDGWEVLVGTEMSWRVSRYEDNKILVVIKSTPASTRSSKRRRER